MGKNLIPFRRRKGATDSEKVASRDSVFWLLAHPSFSLRRTLFANFFSMSATL
jgi:hypothetical protein